MTSSPDLYLAQEDISEVAFVIGLLAWRGLSTHVVIAVAGIQFLDRFLESGKRESQIAIITVLCPLL